MRYSKTAFSLILACALSACSTAKSGLKLDPEQVPHDVDVAVATGCVATTGRPAPVAPLKDTIHPEDWVVMPPSSKAQAVLAQAGRRLNYEQADAAATSSCK